MNAIDGEILRRLGAIEQRLTALEARVEATREDTGMMIDKLIDTNAIQETSIHNLSARMTREALGTLDLIADMREMLDASYDRLFPGFQRFNRRLAKVLRKPLE